MSIFLGIDIGTTAIKLGVICDNKILFSTEQPLTVYGDDTVKYQNGLELLVALEEGILTIPSHLRQKIATIGFSVAMHSLMPDNEQQQIFLWSDLQATPFIDAFKQTEQAADFYQLTGTPIHAMTPFAKIAYFKQNNHYSDDICWYGIKELVLRHFTGQTIVDYATASATGLFDLSKKQWSREILDYLGISTHQLAELVDTTHQVPLLSEIQQYLGLSKDVQVMIGATDGTLAAYASFYHTGRTASLTIGTSAAVRQITKTVSLNPEKQNFCYYLSKEYMVSGAPSNNGGCILTWAANQLSRNPESFFTDLPTILESTTVGAGGLRFFPFLNGERAPYWNNQMKGGFQDLTLQHTWLEMIRSVIEGVLLNVERLVELVANDESLSVSGGFFKTPSLGQLAADIFGTTCYYAPQNEPIFGLYYLLEQPILDREAQEQIFIPDIAKNQVYCQLKKNYFN